MLKRVDVFEMILRTLCLGWRVVHVVVECYAWLIGLMKETIVVLMKGVPLWKFFHLVIRKMLTILST